MEKNGVKLLTAGVDAVIQSYNNKHNEPKEENKFSNLPGNSEQYHLENVEVLIESPLNGKHLAFLGSSVTLGYASLDVSFVDYIAKRNQCTFVKEAVSGTTLVDNGEKSYVQRLLNRMDKDEKFDAFICQLSTNDVRKKMPMGTIAVDSDDFNTSTITGATELIIDYVMKTWNCPVIFYTGAKFDSEQYDDMVKMMYDLKEKWNIEIIDLWNDEAFNAISPEERGLYMSDPVHPTQAGYLLWWTPFIEKELYKILKEAA